MSAAPTEEPVEGVYARRSRLRRIEILQSAMRAFGQRGFYQASLADIAGAAGITAAGLLHHFKTKEALLIELLQLRDASNLAESPGPDQPRGYALLQHLIDTAARNSDRLGTTQLYAVLSAEAVTEGHPAQDWFQGRYAGLRTMIAEAIDEAASAGDIDPSLDPVATATAVIATMDGLQIQWLYAPHDIDMPRVLCELLNALVRPVRPLVVPESV